ncbi:hypothetical protein LSH36_622g02007 [Paralvinella palmiformis]|uniref:Ubiquitin-like protease family profile domain-containing protein n=1 Tax=Paralvinella palmiformis TaxID=53620 RepID=A0AAD9MUT6_9ANNE|nr:hypothetical protein LSH36_622g02007 [Paralvinella palmiformis]
MSWLDLFHESSGKYSGYVTSKDALWQLIQEYEVANSMCFTIVKETTGFEDCDREAAKQLTLIIAPYFPLWELDYRTKQIAESCKIFLRRRFHEGLSNKTGQTWKIITCNHSKQMDSVSCGIFVMKYTDMLMSDKWSHLQFDTTNIGVNALRKEFASILINAADSTELAKHCRLCYQSRRMKLNGLHVIHATDGTTSNHDQCVGPKEEQPTNYYGQPFICRMCQMEDDSDD